MPDFYIYENKYHRFNVEGVKDVRGISGYHGLFEDIIGLIAEKIFHKTVAVESGKDNIYYLNCKSFVNWLKRVAPDKIDFNTEKNSHNAEWVKNTIAAVAEIGRRKILEEQMRDTTHPLDGLNIDFR